MRWLNLYNRREKDRNSTIVVREHNASGTARWTGWKQIATKVDSEPRLVQLWEKHERFVICRLAHRSRASVYPYSGEIDTWLRSRSVEGHTGILAS